MTDPSGGVRFRWCRQPRVSWFVYLLIIFLCCVSFMFHLTRDRRESRYSVVFNVKESSTKVQLFRLGWREGSWSLVNEEYESISQGLMDYLDHPRNGALSIRPLFKRAINAIPESHQMVSTVFLGVAEAGDLHHQNNDTRVERFFNTINSSLFHARWSPFDRSRTFVLNIDAVEEAAYTWSAISLLRETGGENVVIMNLGRYRCQVCFRPKNMEPTMKFNRFMRGVDLYVKNYDRLGVDHARTEVTRSAGAHVCDSHTPDERRFELCFEAIKEHLTNVEVEPMPDLDDANNWNEEIYVRGLFFDFAILGNLIQQHESWQTLKVLYIGSMAEAVCKDRQRNASICFEMTYMYTLFNKSYSLSDETELKFVRRIDYAGVSWTLGLAIAHVYD